MTTYPDVTAHTQRLYDELPELYRDADAGQDLAGLGYPLLRYISLIGDQAGDVEALIDRIDPDDTDQSDLVDPYAADAAWLPWLAQLPGARIAPGLTEDQQRDAIANSVAGWQAGTRANIAAAAKTALTDPTGYVSIRAHYNGDPFTIGVAVDPTYAPADLSTVTAAIENAHARPAGIALAIDTYAVEWGTLEARYPTWGDVTAVTSWGALEATQP